MESLALTAVLIVLPAMIFGPIALALSFIQKAWARIVSTALAASALPSSVLLVSNNISRGATAIGVIGLATSGYTLIRIWQRRQRPPQP